MNSFEGHSRGSRCSSPAARPGSAPRWPRAWRSGAPSSGSAPAGPTGWPRCSSGCERISPRADRGPSTWPTSTASTASRAGWSTSSAASTCWSTTPASPSAAGRGSTGPTRSPTSCASTSSRRSGSPWRCSTRSAPASGQVVFIGSVAARLSPPTEAVYAASKAAITAFAEGLSVDLRVAGSPVGVHVVQPGVLDTELFELPDNDALAGRHRGAAGRRPSSSRCSTRSGSGRIETFVPDWFADLPAIKAGDLDGFLAGSVEYTRQRLEAEGLPAGRGRPVSEPAERTRRAAPARPADRRRGDRGPRGARARPASCPRARPSPTWCWTSPTRTSSAAWSPGDPVDRGCGRWWCPGPELTMVELRRARSPTRRRDRRAHRDRGHAAGAAVRRVVRRRSLACIGNPDYVAALARRGITDLDGVQIDPWPAGVFGYEAEDGRRIARCISFLREARRRQRLRPADRRADRARRPRVGARSSR